MLRRTFPAMVDRPPLLDMTPEGEYRSPAPVLGWKVRAFLAALAASFVVGIVASAALVIYIGVLLVPMAAIAALVSHVAPRLQARRGGSPQDGFPSS